MVNDRNGVPWTAVGTSSANSALTVTKAAVTDRRHVITEYVVSTRGAAVAAVGATVVIKTGTRTIWRDTLTGALGATSGKFAEGLEGDVGAAVSIEVAAGGAGVIAEASLRGLTGA